MITISTLWVVLLCLFVGLPYLAVGFMLGTFMFWDSPAQGKIDAGMKVLGTALITPAWGIAIPFLLVFGGLAWVLDSILNRGRNREPVHPMEVPLGNPEDLVDQALPGRDL